jgi:hypothetical protein
VLAALRQKYAKLRLRVKEEKSTVARGWDRKFLGYSFWVAAGKKVKLRVAPKALTAMKQRVRRITRGPVVWEGSSRDHRLPPIPITRPIVEKLPDRPGGLLTPGHSSRILTRRVGVTGA